MKPEQLYRLGFSLILLKPGKKQPVDGKWSQGPKVALYDILEGIEEGYNLGFRPGVTSKTPDGYYIMGIDLDIRDPVTQQEATEKLNEIFGKKFLKKCARVISGSGGASRHFYFVMKRPMRAKTIAHSKDKFLCPKTNKMRWKWEIEVFGEGKQMVLPPSIHPDTGKEYEWAVEPDDLPELDTDRLEEILDDLTRAASDFNEEEMKPLGIKLAEARKILDNLDFEHWFVERDGWRNVGMALHHEFEGSADAYRLWTEFSKKSNNFDSNEQRYQWSTFGRNDRVRPFRMASLIKEAHEEEIRNAFQPTEDDAAEIREERRQRKERVPRQKARNDSSSVGNGYRIRQPKRLLTIPGILGEIVDTYNASAPRPQPQFAVHVALALGSVILGRNWKTDGSNYSSLFMLMLGRTASGKEHGLKVVEKVLEQCELDLVGPARYTSDAGLMSALEIRPKHISLADEFSRYLKAARGSGDANQSNAQSALMEIWGRLDGTHRNKGYSARGMTKAQIEAMAASHVKRPALTLLGVAVPDDFYSAIGNEDVANGFLNRFLIVETEVPRLPMQKHTKPVEVSSQFRKWARENAFPVTDDDEDIMDAINRNDPVNPGDPIVVKFSKKSWEFLDRIDEECLRKMDELDQSGLDGLYGRAREIIMRISLIIARSCEEDMIEIEHVEWAKDYFFYHATKLEIRTRDDMGASELQRNVNICLKLIEDASNSDQLGLTTRELAKASWAFRNLDTRNREEIVKLLMSDHGVVIRNLKRNADGGRTRSLKLLTTLEEE